MASSSNTLDERSFIVTVCSVALICWVRHNPGSLPLMKTARSTTSTNTTIAMSMISNLAEFKDRVLSVMFLCAIVSSCAGVATRQAIQLEAVPISSDLTALEGCVIGSEDSIRFVRLSSDTKECRCEWRTAGEGHGQSRYLSRSTRTGVDR